MAEKEQASWKCGHCGYFNKRKKITKIDACDNCGGELETIDAGVRLTVIELVIIGIIIVALTVSIVLKTKGIF